MRKKRGRPPAPKVKRLAKPGSSPVGLGLKLLRMRTERHQYEIAQEAGITKGMLSAYESGRQHPSFQTLLKILAALKADLRDLQAAIDAAAVGIGPAPNSTAPAPVKAPGDADAELARAILLLRALRSPSAAPPEKPSVALPLLGVIGGRAS